MKKFTEFLAATFWFCIDNGPTLLSLLFCTYIVLLSKLSTVSDHELLRWILTVMGLFAASMFVERFRKINVMARQISDISISLGDLATERISAERFFFDTMPAMESFWEKADTIWASGVVMQSLILPNVHLLEKRLRAGAHIKILIVDPDCAAAKEIANPTLQLTHEYLQANSRVTLQNLRWLANRSSGSGSIEARYRMHIPKFSLLAADPEKEYGTAIVGLYRQFWSHNRLPHFQLSRKRDGPWFDFFITQFEEIWDASTPVDLKTGEQSVGISSLVKSALPDDGPQLSVVNSATSAPMN